MFYNILITIIFLSHPFLSFSAEHTEQKEIKFKEVRPPIPAVYNGIKNPFERNDKTILAGETLYDINCSPCHGGNLDGKGPEADGLFPRPANLTELLTIIRPPESYIFWRIREGGPGLPKNWKPWNSAMPVWKERLKDKEIWQIIMYLYATSGESPP